MLASSSTVKTYCTSKLAFEQPEKHSFRKLETIFTKVRKDFYFIFLPCDGHITVRWIY